MLLIIHNLPSNTTYSDVKNIVWNKCGLQEMIVDQLVNDGAGKKVTIGLADEGDAAILVRKINGLFINGQHLYVEDVRKQRAADQPYGSIAKPADKTRPYCNEYQDIEGYNPTPIYDSTMSSNMTMIGQQPIMQDYNMPAEEMYYGKIDQNSAIMGYANQNQTMVPQHPDNSYHEHVYGYQPQMVENNCQSNNKSLGYQAPMAQDKIRSNNRSQGYQPQTVEDNFQRNNTSQGYQPSIAQDKFHSNNRSQGYQPQMVEDNFQSNRSQGYQPQMVNDKYQGNTRSHGYQPQMVEDKFIDNRSQSYQPEMVEDKFYGYDRSQANQGKNSRRGMQRRQSPTPYHGRGQKFLNTRQLGRDNENKPVRENVRRNQTPHNEAWNTRGRNQQSNQSFDIAYPQREPSRDAIQNFGQQRPQRGGFGASVSNDDYYRDIKLNDNRKSFEQCEAQIYGNHVTGTQVSFLNSRNPSSKRDFSGPHRVRDNFDPGNVPKTDNNGPYQSQNPNPKTISQRRTGQGNSGPKPFPYFKQIKKKTEFGSRQPNKKIFETNNKASHFGEKRPFQNQKPKSNIFGSVNKSFNERNAFDEKRLIKHAENVGANAFKRPHDAATFKSEPPKKKFVASNTYKPKEAGPIDSQTWPKKAREPGLTASQLISRDQTWRMQAAADLAKLMINNFLKVEDPKDEPVYFNLKSSIRSRIDVVLGEQFAVPPIEIINLYSKRFNPRTDKSFFDAILEKVNSTKQETQSHITKGSTSVKPSQKATASVNATAVGPLTGKAAMKEQKEISKAEYLGEKVYTLPPDLHKALENETETIGELCVTECEDCQDEKEKVICEKIVGRAIPDLKKILSLNITKRILKITTGLFVRIIGTPRQPPKAALELFLRDYGCVDLKKCDNKMHIGKIDTYENFDKLCALKSTVIGDITVKFDPLHVAGPPEKPTKQKIIDQRAQWIENQIDKSIKTDKVDQGKERDGTIDQNKSKKIVNDQAIMNSNKISVENTVFKGMKIKYEKDDSEDIKDESNDKDKIVNNIKIEKELDSTGEIIDKELKEIQDILDNAAEETEATEIEDLENVTLDELLDIDLDDDDLEDY